MTRESAVPPSTRELPDYRRRRLLAGIAAGAAELVEESTDETAADADDETANLEPGITIVRPYSYGALHKSFVHRAASHASFMLSSTLTALRVRRASLVATHSRLGSIGRR